MLMKEDPAAKKEKQRVLFTVVGSPLDSDDSNPKKQQKLNEKISTQRLRENLVELSVLSDAAMC